MDYNGTSVPRRVAWIDTNNSTEYHDVTTSIMLRKEKPYKVLSDPGRSAVTVSLHLPSGVSDIAVTLNHCSTSDEVRIYFQVNSEFLYRSYHVASSDDFSEHTFRVPLNTIKIGNNKMVLGLNEGSQGEYLLSDLNIRTVSVTDMAPQRTLFVVESETLLKTTNTRLMELIEADEARDVEGRLCKILKTPGESAAIFIFHLPTGHQQVQLMNVTLNGCGSSEMIDILVNWEVLVEKYSVVNSGHSDEQSFSIPVKMLRAGTYNRLVIRLNKESRESYWLPHLIIFYSVVTNDIWIDTNNSEKYIELETSEDYRNGRPYKIFSTPKRSKAHFMIYLPDNKPAQEVTLTLNHCKTTCGGSIDILVNGKEHLMNYDGAWWKDFQEQTFPIPEKILKAGINVLTVRLNEGSRGVYWLSDVKIEY